MLLALAGMCLACIGINRETLGVFCLLIGPPLAGALMRAFGIAHVGAPASLLIGVFLLWSAKSRTRMLRARWSAPMLWLLLTAGVLVASYFMGPQTDYCQAKLFAFMRGLLIGVFALTFVVANHKVDLRALGILAVTASAVHYSTTAYVWPEVIPSSIFIPAGLRPLDRDLIAEVRPAYAGVLACFGIMCLLGSLATRELRRRRYLGVLLPLAAGMLVVNSVGQRLYIGIVFLAALLLVLCRPKDKAVSRLTVVLIITVCAVVVTAGFAKGNVHFVQTFTPEQRSIYERLNRSFNWGSAFRRIGEKPWWGHGLGGYYLDERTVRSEPGEGRYAHNLVLELLSETGILGTSLILAPVILFCFVPIGRRLLVLRTRGGDALVFVLLYALCYAFVCDDLRQSHLLFALAAVIWAYMPRREDAPARPVPATAPGAAAIYQKTGGEDAQ
jgi:O-antigen ligase